MRYNGPYNMEITSYGTQGTQITITRKYSIANLAAVMALCASALYVYIINEGNTTDQKCFFFAVAFLTFLYSIQLLNKIKKETLLILTSLGVTVKQERLFSSTTRYYDMHHIEDIVIIEAVSMHSVICQLVLLPKVLNSCDKKEGKLYPLFQTFQPSLEDLKTIYRHIHTRLVPAGQLQDR